MTANLIAENMFATVNEEGHRHLLLDSIIDFRKNDDTIKQEDAFIIRKSDTWRRRETTKGWEILVQWKVGTTTWHKMKDINDSYPVQLAEFAIQNKLQDEPVFAWWVKYTIKKKNRIIAKIKS